MTELILKLSDRIQVRVTNDDESEVLKQAAFFHAWPTSCPLCGAAIRITYRHPQNYEYYGLECDGTPSHETNFGQRKDGSGLYYDESREWRVWEPKTNGDRDRDAYTDQASQQRPATAPVQKPDPTLCSSCYEPITPAMSQASTAAHGRPMCPRHMAAATEARRREKATR